MNLPSPSKTLKPERTRADLLAFAQQQPLAPGVLQQRYMVHVRVPGFVHDPRRCPRIAIYEFEWGFVAEIQMDAGEVFWNLHARALWETPPGPDSQAMQDRIYRAYNEVIRTEATQLVDADQAPVTLWTEDPRAYDAALAFCAPCTNCLSVVREWIAARLLGVLWPETLDRVLSTDYQFTQPQKLPANAPHGFAPLASGQPCSHEGMRNDDNPCTDQ